MTTEEQAMKDVVEEFVQNGYKFTAYNITTEARKRGLQAKHNDVKEVVHDMYRAGELDGYNRTVVDPTGNGDSAFLYQKDASTAVVDTDPVDADADADTDTDDSDVVAPMDF